MMSRLTSSLHTGNLLRGTWVNLMAATKARLDKLQNWLLRMALQEGQGAPLASLAWESG